MKFSLASCLAMSIAAYTANAAEVTIQVGNPTAATNPQKFQFLPKVTKVAVGDTVKFLFMGNHSVTQQATFNACTPGTSQPGGTPFDSNVLPKGESFTIPAASLVAGTTINYYCKVGAGAHCRSPNFMQGALVVTGGEVGATATATAGAGAGAPGATATPAGGAATPAGGAAATPAAGAAGAAGQTVTVLVGQGGNKFTPEIVNAAPGDTVLFKWAGGMHNIVPSDAPQSCEKSTKLETDPTLKKLASGAPQTGGEFKFEVPATTPVGTKLWYYCAVGTHCSAGKMYGTINVVAPGTGGGAATAGTEGGAGGAGGAAGNGTEGAPPAGAASDASSMTAASAFVVTLAAGTAALLL